MPRSAVALLVIVVAVLAGGYLWRANTSAPSAGTPVLRIGAVLPLTGPGASIGQILGDSLRWKIDELRMAGHNIEYIVEDSQSGPKQAVTAYSQLVNVRGVKIIFSTLSAVSMALKPFADRDKVLLWADAAHPQLTMDTNYVLRHSNLSDQEAVLVSGHIINRQLKRVGVLYQQDDWGVAAGEETVRLLQAAGVTASAESIDHRAADFRTALTKIKSGKPQAMVFIAVGAAAGLLVQQAKEVNYAGDIYSSIGWILTPDAQTIAGSYAQGMYYTDYLENIEFDQAYRAKFGVKAPAFGHVGYTDIELLWQAVQVTGSTEPEKIIAYVKGLGSFKGAYEDVTIASNGDIAVPMIIKQW